MLRHQCFSRADAITIVFCGSKKSLVNGIPIATLLFAGHVGLVVILLMLFHQIQLMVCASLARHYAARRVKVNEPLPALSTTLRLFVDDASKENAHEQIANFDHIVGRTGRR